MENKLKIIYILQILDSYLDNITYIKKKFKKKILKIEEDFKNIKKNKEEVNNEILDLKKKKSFKKNKIQETENLIKKYKKNEKKDFFIKKEIDYQYLEIELLKKKINNIKEKNNKKKEEYKKIEKNLLIKKIFLKNKKKEINNIIKINKIKKEKIKNLYNNYIQNINKIDKNLLNLYKNIRKNIKDGIAVTTIYKKSSIGSYLFIPKQLRWELYKRKKIILDEHSGRILIDNELADKIEKKVKKEISKIEKEIINKT